MGRRDQVVEFTLPDVVDVERLTEDVIPTPALHPFLREHEAMVVVAPPVTQLDGRLVRLWARLTKQ
jgi:hypothetical protein